MPFSPGFEPERMVSLTAVVDQHCLQAGIDMASPARTAIAQLVMVLVEANSATIEDLKAALLLSSERQEAARYGLLTLAFRSPCLVSPAGGTPSIPRYPRDLQ